MKTTVDIDAPILKNLKDISAKENLSFKKIIDEVLQLGLTSRKMKKPARQFEWKTKPLKPRIPIEDKDLITEILDKK